MSDNKSSCDNKSGRVHLIAGGFPPGSHAGHDHDYARLRLLGLLAESDIPASVANDFTDVEKWLPVSRLLITYVAGPIPTPRNVMPSGNGWRPAAIGWDCMGPAAARRKGWPACAAPHREDRASRAAWQLLPDPPADPQDSALM